jgi:hypothetical protein
MVTVQPLIVRFIRDVAIIRNRADATVRDAAQSELGKG